MLFASTCEVYGNAERHPDAEDEPVRPISPYAVTKAAAELACCAARRSTSSSRGRSTTKGPGHDERFAVGSWARQIARLEREGGGDAARRRPDGASATCRRARRLPRPTGCCSTRPCRPAPTTSRPGAASRWRTSSSCSSALARVPVQVERDEAALRAGRHAAALRRRRAAARRDRLGARDPARADARRPARARPRELEPRLRDERTPRADHRHHRPGRLVPGRAAAGQGLRGLRHDPPRLDRELRAHRAPARPRRPASRPTCSTSRRSTRRCARPQPHEVYNLAAQSFVPDVVDAAGADRRVHRPRRDAHARGDPHRRPGDPLLPGLLVRDVRQGARGARRPS